MDDRANFEGAELVHLLGSRLCHDLVNPLSAVSNGVELLRFGQSSASPELSLIDDAARGALARIRFYRIAFGAARPDDVLAAREIRRAVEGVYGPARQRVHWPHPQDLPRPEVRIAFLMLACCEAMLPLGGDIWVTHDADRWSMSAESEKLMVDDACLDCLETGQDPNDLSPARVQFGLLGRIALRMGRRVDIAKSGDGHRIELSI